ncbi:MFS transporter, partial [Sutterella sp.]|uniref:MFS transporter n=1 Tax=Sutterella sp. TaxID=1981025 RepID=UPI0026DFCDA5
MKPTQSSTPPAFKDGVILAFAGTLGPFAANTYVPAFGEISAALGVSMVAVQQSLSLYLLAFAIASLFVGAVSDAFGRRPVLIGATIIFAVASVGAMMSETVEALCAWRVLMGICASSGPVLSQAIARDRWQGVDAAKIVALMAILFGVGPALAPIVGGELTVLFGWRSVFVFLALLSLGISLTMAVFLKESLPPERRVSFRPLATIVRYGSVLRSPPLVAGCVAHGFCFMGLIVYSAGAADFVIHVLGLGVDGFGWVMIPFVGISMVGAWLSPKLLARFGSTKVVLTGIAVLIASGLLGALSEWKWPAMGYPLLIAAPMVYNFAAAAIRPIVNVMNLDYFPRSRGLAASVQQFCLTSAFCISSA